MTSRRPPSIEQRLRELRPSIERAAYKLYFPREREDLIAIGVAKAWELLSKREYEPWEEGLIIAKARWAMIDHLRYLWPGARRRHGMLAAQPRAPVSFETLNELQRERLLTSVQPDALEQLLQADEARTVEQLLRGMSDRDAFIVREIMNGRKQHEIAKDLGISGARVSQLLTRIKRKAEEKLK